jgi:hypothetical protein
METDKNDGVHRQTVFCVITVARQIEGEYVCIRTEKGFTQASKADALLKELKNKYVDEQGRAKTIRLDTPHGALDCICEVGAFEIELED